MCMCADGGQKKASAHLDLELQLDMGAGNRTLVLILIKRAASILNHRAIPLVPSHLLDLVSSS